jgi:hypothetical protein
MEEKKTQEVKLEIQLDEDIAQGIYANLAVANHNESELVLDFIYVQPQGSRAKVRSRVILSPQNAKRLVTTLQESISHHEQQAGKARTATPVESPSSNRH